MKALILCAALAAAGTAMAQDMVHRQGDNSLRLMAAPCENAAVLAMVPPEVRHQVQAAVAQFEGKSTHGCWLAHGGVVQVQYEDGDQGRVRATSFQAEPGV